MPGITNDGLILQSNGDVEDFKPEIIEAARQEVAQRVGFHQRHCETIGCENCRLPACPMAD